MGEIIDEKNSEYFKFLENLFDKLLHGKIGSMVVRPILNKLIYFNIYLANLCEKHLLIKWRRNFITSILFLFYTIGILIAILILASLPILSLYLTFSFSTALEKENVRYNDKIGNDASISIAINI